VPLPSLQTTRRPHSRLLVVQCADWLKVPGAPMRVDLRGSYAQNDETRRRNSLMYMSKVNLPIALTLVAAGRLQRCLVRRGQSACELGLGLT